MTITQKLVPKSKYATKCPYTMTPKYVVIHNTANDAPAQNEIHYMSNRPEEVSFHFAVDDQEAVQGIPEDRNAWHAGDGNGPGNRSGIGIEICYSLSGGSRFAAAEQNAAELAAMLLKKHGLSIDRLKKHQDFDGKRCPHRTLDLGWPRFVSMVQQHLAPDTPFSPYTVRITCDVLNIRRSPTTDSAITGQIRDRLRYTIVEEAPGKGAEKGWGRLKSGAGWISLDWVQRADA